MNRDALIQKAEFYRSVGQDLPADLWTDLLAEGVCPKTLMSEEEYFENQAYLNGKEE